MSGLQEKTHATQKEHANYTESGGRIGTHSHRDVRQQCDPLNHQFLWWACKCANFCQFSSRMPTFSYNPGEPVMRWVGKSMSVYTLTETVENKSTSSH